MLSKPALTPPDTVTEVWLAGTEEKEYLGSGQDSVYNIQFNINSPIQKVLQDNPDTYSEFGIVHELVLLP